MNGHEWHVRDNSWNRCFVLSENSCAWKYFPVFFWGKKSILGERSGTFFWLFQPLLAFAFWKSRPVTTRRRWGVWRWCLLIGTFQTWRTISSGVVCSIANMSCCSTELNRSSLILRRCSSCLLPLWHALRYMRVLYFTSLTCFIVTAQVLLRRRAHILSPLAPYNNSVMYSLSPGNDKYYISYCTECTDDSFIKSNISGCVKRRELFLHPRLMCINCATWTSLK